MGVIRTMDPAAAQSASTAPAKSDSEGLQARLDSYRAIEEYRGRPLIVFATSTRPGVQAIIAPDALSEIVEQVREIGKADGVDILLHSHGGDSLTAWRIMSILRESYPKVAVLVPFAAFSAATVLSLGADEIVMHPFAALGPIDPQIQARTDKGDIHFAYEDVGAFLKFIKENVGVTEQSYLTPIMDKLFSLANPLLIGAAQRASDLSSEIGERMLRMHKKAEKDAARCKQIAKELNKSFFSHGDAVSRRRATELGLPIAKSDPTLEGLIWKAYKGLEEFMQLLSPFNPLTTFMGNAAAAATLTPPPPVVLPLNTTPDVANQVWNVVLQRAIQQATAGASPEVAYRLVKVVIEGTRRSSAIITEGLVWAVRQGIEVKLAGLDTKGGWVNFPMPPTASVQSQAGS